MKNIYLLALSVCLAIGCKNDTKDTESTPGTKEQSTAAKPTAPDTTVAVAFISDYIAYSKKMSESAGITEWISARPDVTQKFKDELKKIVDEGNKQEMGLDADPVFNAQDYPEAVEVVSVDESGYVILQGKNWPEYKLALQLKQENGKWLVDGCGIVNIPKNKQMFL